MTKLPKELEGGRGDGNPSDGWDPTPKRRAHFRSIELSSEERGLAGLLKDLSRWSFISKSDKAESLELLAEDERQLLEDIGARTGRELVRREDDTLDYAGYRLDPKHMLAFLESTAVVELLEKIKKHESKEIGKDPSDFAYHTGEVVPINAMQRSWLVGLEMKCRKALGAQAEPAESVEKPEIMEYYNNNRGKE